MSSCVLGDEEQNLNIQKMTRSVQSGDEDDYDDELELNIFNRNKLQKLIAARQEQEEVDHCHVQPRNVY